MLGNVCNFWCCRKKIFLICKSDPFVYNYIILLILSFDITFTFTMGIFKFQVITKVYKYCLHLKEGRGIH